MKKRALVMAGLIALTVMASTRTARSQEMLVENIPSGLVAGHQPLPAGACAVKAACPTHTLLLINCRSPDDSRLLNKSADGTKDFQSQPKLVSGGFADRYFFSQVWTDGNYRRSQLSKSAREKEMTLLAKIEIDDQITMVASLLRANP